MIAITAECSSLVALSQSMWYWEGGREGTHLWEYPRKMCMESPCWNSSWQELQLVESSCEGKFTPKDCSLWHQNRGKAISVWCVTCLGVMRLNFPPVPHRCTPLCSQPCQQINLHLLQVLLSSSRYSKVQGISYPMNGACSPVLFFSLVFLVCVFWSVLVQWVLKGINQNFHSIHPVLFPPWIWSCFLLRIGWGEYRASFKGECKDF